MNVKRRNLTQSQKAIAAAEAAVKIDLPSREISALFGISNGYAKQSRVLLARDPIGAEEVKTGARSLADAYDALRAREGKQTSRAADIRKLAEAAPDLAEAVKAGKASLTPAYEALREAEEASRRMGTSAASRPGRRSR